MREGYGGFSVYGLRSDSAVVVGGSKVLFELCCCGLALAFLQTTYVHIFGLVLPVSTVAEFHCDQIPDIASIGVA